MKKNNKLVLVGYSPSHGKDPKRPLDGPGSGHRLAKLFGLEHDEYLRQTERINLHYCTPKKNSRELNDRSARWIREVLTGHRFILLGREVARSFGVEDQFSWYKFTWGSCAAIPHPSGLCRWWNDAKNVRRAEKFLREALNRGR